MRRPGYLGPLQHMSKHLSVPEALTISHPQWPGWVRHVVGPCLITRAPDASPALYIQAGEVGRHAMLEARIISASAMDGPTFQREARDAYLALARILKKLRACHAVRFWNYLPAIHASAGPGQDRYMAFNAGRHEAFRAWFGGTEGFAQLLPTATGVGHGGDDLVIHLLACTEPGVPVENPRQRPAYRFSPQFGPLPPCFSRATLLPRGKGLSPLILVGGTSSVCGEDSVHVNDLSRQTLETLENMGVLVRAACGMATDGNGGGNGGKTPSAPADGLDAVRPWLGRFRELRVYLPRAEDEGMVMTLVREHFGNLDQVEIFPAELCRAELRVEIAGLAEVESG